MIWVENGILADFRRALELTGLEPRYDIFPSASASLQAELAERLEDQGYLVALLRSSRATEAARTLGPELEARIRSGTLRLVYWGNPLPVKDPEARLLPAIHISPDASVPILRSLILHLTRAGLPGIYSTLPEGSLIVTEKLSTESEIGRKLDKILDLAQGKTETRVNPPWVMRARLAVSSCLVPAFEDYRRSPDRVVCPRIQLGIAGSAAAFGVRWRAASFDIDDWTRRALADPSSGRECEPWQVSARFSDALWFQLLPDSGEVEIVMLVTAGDEVDGGSRPSRLLGIDLITNDRLRNKSRSEPENTELGDFRFQALELTPSPPAPAETVPPAAPMPEIESPAVAALKTENEKLSNKVAGYREQLRSVSRRMRELLQFEENSRIEARRLALQLKREQDRNGISMVYEELKATRNRLAESSAREQELNRKLLLCLEKLEKLQGQVQTIRDIKGKQES